MSTAPVTKKEVKKPKLSKQEVVAIEVEEAVQPYRKTGTEIIQVPAVEDEAGYIAYVEKARAIKGKMTNVDDAYDDLIAQANKQHKDTIAKKRTYWQPLKNLLDAFERQLTAFRDKKERERLDAQRKLEEEAQRRQQELLTAEAATLEREGRPEEAAQVLEEAMVVERPVITAPSTLPQVFGSYSRNLPWQFEIINQEAVRDEYWTPDVDAIAAVVKAKGPLAENLIGKGSVRIWRGTKTVIKA